MPDNEHPNECYRSDTNAIKADANQAQATEQDASSDSSNEHPAAESIAEVNHDIKADAGCQQHRTKDPRTKDTTTV